MCVCIYIYIYIYVQYYLFTHTQLCSLATREGWGKSGGGGDRPKPQAPGAIITTINRITIITAIDRIAIITVTILQCITMYYTIPYQDIVDYIVLIVL